VTIKVNEPLISDRDIEMVTRSLRDGWISGEGPFVEEFERRWAEYCGMPYGVAVSSGTAALELAVASLGLRTGDEVIIPTFTIIACALAVIEAGATPVLVDADPGTWCMDVAQVEARITARTRAVMPVHIYGHPVDMDPLLRCAERHDLAVVEDAAEAHGATYRGRRVGGLGDLGCFSFYANKIVTTGEGGMVLGRDPSLAGRLRSGRNLGFGPGRRFEHAELARNYRLSSIQAAMGVAQIERMEEHLARKAAMGAYYDERLRSTRGLVLPPKRGWATNVYWMYGLVLDDDVPFDASELARRLDARGIETRPFFLGMHEQPALRARGLFEGERYPVAERLARRGLYLPSGLALTRAQQDVVISAVADAMRS
jgi:perosamine synthetase